VTKVTEAELEKGTGGTGRLGEEKTRRKGESKGRRFRA